MTQLDRTRPKMQPAAGTGSEINGAHRILRGQSQAIGGRAAARNNRFAPERGKRPERLVDARRTLPEPGLDGAHVDALADPHQLTRTRETRQRLIDGCPLAEVKKAGRTQRRRFRKAFGILHDALGDAAHDRNLLSRVRNRRNRIPFCAAKEGAATSVPLPWNRTQYPETTFDREICRLYSVSVIENTSHTGRPTDVAA